MVEITADGQLATSSVKIGSNPVIYPNPVNDVLNIKSEKLKVNQILPFMLNGP